MRASLAKFWPVACVGLLLATSLAPQDPKPAAKPEQARQDQGKVTFPVLPGELRARRNLFADPEGMKPQLQGGDDIAPGHVPPVPLPQGDEPFVEVERKVPLPDPAKAEAAIKPTKLAAIPDNPAPHEGHTFALPYRVEPPDLIIVEVLDALPGRPIQGDRLVEPDGRISLGFYGDVLVASLTTEQIKEKIIHHLRTFLTDQQLGLVRYKVEEQSYVDVEPKDSDRVFVCVGAFNTKIYYVQGWVGYPGRLPITGRDTILDALNYSGGVLQGAITDEIHLFRPARGDQPIRDYKIDLEAIYKGDAKANLQLFPGDRLIVPGPPGNKNAILSGPSHRRDPPDFVKAPRHDEPVTKGKG